MSFFKELHDAKKAHSTRHFFPSIDWRALREWEKQQSTKNEIARLSAARKILVDTHLNPVKRHADNLIRDLASATWGDGYGWEFMRNTEVIWDQEPLNAAGSPEVLARWLVGRTEIISGDNYPHSSRWQMEIGRKAREHAFNVQRRTHRMAMGQQIYYQIDLRREGNQTMFVCGDQSSTGAGEAELKDLLKRVFIKGPTKS